LNSKWRQGPVNAFFKNVLAAFPRVAKNVTAGNVEGCEMLVSFNLSGIDIPLVLLAEMLAA
jgi:hypothetical protein